MKIISSGSWSKDWTSLALNLEVFHVMVSRGGQYILLVPTKWISSKASKCTWILWVQIDEGSCRYVYTPININQCMIFLPTGSMGMFTVNVVISFVLTYMCFLDFSKSIINVLK